MSDFIPNTRTFTGRKMLITIVAFFGVIIAVNGLMLTLAVQSFGGLVVGNSYVASQNFNEDVAAARIQPIRGWQLSLSSAPDARIALEVKDEDGLALRGLTLTLEMARPTHERGTVVLDPVEVSAGLYSAPVALPPGRWIATVRTDDGQTRSLTFDHARPQS
jgi:nitrogen fixation protein FixH